MLLAGPQIAAEAASAFSLPGCCCKNICMQTSCGVIGVMGLQQDGGLTSPGRATTTTSGGAQQRRSCLAVRPSRHVLFFLPVTLEFSRGRSDADRKLWAGLDNQHQGEEQLDLYWVTSLLAGPVMAALPGRWTGAGLHVVMETSCWLLLPLSAEVREVRMRSSAGSSGRVLHHIWETSQRDLSWVERLISALKLFLL